MKRRGFLQGMAVALAGSKLVRFVADRGHHTTEYTLDEGGMGYVSEDRENLRWRDLDGIGSASTGGGE